MAQRFRQRQTPKTAATASQEASGKTRQPNKSFGNVDDGEEQLELLGEETPDADIDDSTDNEDDEYREDYDSEAETIFSESDAQPVSGTRPIWLWCAGQIVWSAERYGFNLIERENMRRKMNEIIAFLRENLCMDVTPLILEKFFLQESLSLPEISADKENEEAEPNNEEKPEDAEKDKGKDAKKKKLGSWLSHLGTAGIMIDGSVYPLDSFILKRGDKSATMPDALEFL